MNVAKVAFTAVARRGADYAGVVRALRPGAGWWLWYAVGGRLPDRYHEWLLCDLTCRGWVFRHFTRAVVQLSVWWLVLLLPIPLSLRLAMVGMGFAVGLYFSLAFLEDACERRLVRHGYPAGLNRRIREECPPDRRAEVAAAYAAYYAPGHSDPDD